MSLSDRVKAVDTLGHNPDIKGNVCGVRKFQLELQDIPQESEAFNIMLADKDNWPSTLLSEVLKEEFGGQGFTVPSHRSIQNHRNVSGCACPSKIS